ncbi:transcriptional regulator [Anabaena azotica]|uniref:Transcriptional regulator n=1 Tax=Anabaena azotica FACHB-119 TaxID=947527 RepID=A0ABR8CZ80_9NOST|nr:transcriptional regulator [Anabaena azotica]MBD2500147.1 transcriptional regulator [Anabaena azotica FACHB-119]
MTRKPYSELRKRMTPERRAENETRAKMMLLHLNLMELKQSLALTNDNLENDLSVFDSAISELETQEDMQISTLSNYIKALGGSLKLVAEFPDKEIVLTQFN